MAPITATLAPTFARSADGVSYYSGRFDKDWAIGSVPNGGYSLSALLNAAQHHMRNQAKGATLDAHVDPLHVQGLYLEATSCDVPYEIRVRQLKAGRGFTHLEVVLEQEHYKSKLPTQRLLAHVIMTNFVARIGPGSVALDITIPKASGFHVSCPISRPSTCGIDKRFAKQSKFGRMRDRLTILKDEEMEKRVKETHRLEDGAWLLLDKMGDERKELQQKGVGNNTISFFLDMGPPALELIPSSEGFIPKGERWYPTLSLSIEFKRPLPYDQAVLRAGTYTTGRHLIGGQFETDCEVWSHPDDAPLFGQPAGSGSHILAIGRQVGVTFPLAFNLGQGKPKDAGQKDAKSKL